MRTSTISHHQGKLSEVGLVSAKASNYYNIYQLEEKTLETMVKHLLSDESLLAMDADVDLNCYNKKVVAEYSLPDGLLKTITAQRKKLEAILRYISCSFEPDVQYTELQVNEILENYHEDTSQGADRSRFVSKLIWWESLLAR